MIILKCVGPFRSRSELERVCPTLGRWRGRAYYYGTDYYGAWCETERVGAWRSYLGVWRRLAASGFVPTEDPPGRECDGIAVRALELREPETGLVRWYWVVAGRYARRLTEDLFTVGDNAW